MHQKCIRNLSQIKTSLPRSQSLKYYKNQNKHTYFFLYYLYLSQIYPKFNLLSLYLTYSNTVKIPNASEMHQKCIRNLSQIKTSLPRSQSLKYYKNQNKHTYFFLYYLYLSQIQPSLPISHLLKYCKNPKCIPNLLADEKGLKLDQIPPVPRYITHKIKDYIPCVHFKVNRVRIWLICTHRWRVNLKKWWFLGFWLMKRVSNWTKSPQYLGISPIKLKIIFHVYISRWIGLESDWSVPTGEG